MIATRAARLLGRATLFAAVVLALQPGEDTAQAQVAQEAAPRPLNFGA
jgi:hypothetical protein